MKVGKARERKRLRGAFSGKSGRVIGATSIAAPIVGFIVNDLRKPDSLIRSIVGSAKRALLDSKTNRAKAIDISDEVEVIEDQTEREP